MVDKIEKIYKAIRRTYGYGDDADELIDSLAELMECYESRKEK